jgi:hypothetical protein
LTSGAQAHDWHHRPPRPPFHLPIGRSCQPATRTISFSTMTHPIRTSPISSSYRSLAPAGHPHLLLLHYDPSHSAPPTARRLPTALAAPPPPYLTAPLHHLPPPDSTAAPESPLDPAWPPVPNNLNPNLSITTTIGENHQPATWWRPRRLITPPAPPPSI